MEKRARVKSMETTWIIALVVLIVLFAITMTIGVRSDSNMPRPPTLDDRVNSLERRVDELEERGR